MASESFATAQQVIGLASHCDAIRQRWRSLTTDQSGGPTLHEYFQPLEADVRNPPTTWPTSGSFIDRALTHLGSSAQAPPLVVVGEVGSGKSTLCLKLATEILERVGRPLDPRPLVVPVGKLKAGGSPPEMVARWVGEGISGGPCSGAVLEQSVAAGDVVLFLDGLDEGHPSLGTAGVLGLLDWAVRLAKTSRCRVVLTSRLEYYRRIAAGENRLRRLMLDATVVELNPLGASAVERLCGAWFHGTMRGIDDALALLPSVPLLRHPLFVVRALNTTHADGNEGAKATLATFLDELLLYVIEEREEKKDLPMSVRPLSRHRMLEELCIAALRDNRLDVTNGAIRLDAALARDVVFRRVEDQGESPLGGDVDERREGALLELIARTVLVQEDDAHLRIVHPWLFECLVARRIAELMAQSGTEAELFALLRRRPLQRLPLVRRLVAAYLAGATATMETERSRELLRLCSEDSASGKDSVGFTAGNLLSVLVSVNRAMLRQMAFRGQRLVEANLSGADLTGTDLSNCDLAGAGLWGTNLAGAKLTGAKLQAAHVDPGDIGPVLDVAFFPGDVHLVALHARGYRVWNVGQRSIESGADWGHAVGAGAVAAPMGDWVLIARPGAHDVELVSSDGLDQLTCEVGSSPEAVRVTGLCWGGVGDSAWLRSEKGGLWRWIGRIDGGAEEKAERSNVGRFESVLSKGFPARGPFACGGNWAAAWTGHGLFLVTESGWREIEEIGDVQLSAPAIAGMASQLAIQLEPRKVALYSIELVGPRIEAARTSILTLPADIYSIDLRRDGLLVAAGDDRRVHFRSAVGLEATGPELPGPIRALRFSPTGRHLACAVEPLLAQHIEVHVFRFGKGSVAPPALSSTLKSEVSVKGADFRGCVISNSSLRERLIRAGAVM